MSWVRLSSWQGERWGYFLFRRRVHGLGACSLDCSSGPPLGCGFETGWLEELKDPKSQHILPSSFRPRTGHGLSEAQASY